MRLRDVLTAPFVLRCESVERSDGSWVRMLSYPELGCSTANADLVAAMDQLELHRVRELVHSVARGKLPATLRASIPDVGVEDLLDRAGFPHWISRLDEEI
jgi:hypothetical protein